MFFYQNDTQETDIEYLTDPLSQSNFGPDQPIPIWYTNQVTDPVNAEKTSQHGPAPANVTESIHEYRLDWTPDYTAFYLDGVLQKQYKVNVPSVPGPWVWNNWANGDRGTFLILMLHHETIADEYHNRLVSWTSREQQCPPNPKHNHVLQYRMRRIKELWVDVRGRKDAGSEGV